MRERNIQVQEKHPIIAFCCPQPVTWPATQACALLTRNQTRNPFSLWGHTQPTEPHQSGLVFISDPKNAVLIALFQAGNVVTGEMVEELILSGADIIKVGIGPGKLAYWGTAGYLFSGKHLWNTSPSSSSHSSQALCVPPGRKLEWGIHSSVR